MNIAIFTLLIISVMFESCSSDCISVPTVKQSDTFIGKIPYYGTDYKTIWIKPGRLFYYIKFSLVINSKLDFQADKEHRDNLVINSPAINLNQWSHIKYRILRTAKIFSRDIYTLEATLNWHSEFTKTVSLWTSLTSVKNTKVYVSGDSEIAFDCRPIETTTTTTSTTTPTTTTTSTTTPTTTTPSTTTPITTTPSTTTPITTTTSTTTPTTTTTSTTTPTTTSTTTPATTTTTSTPTTTTTFTSIPATTTSLTITPISSAATTSPSSAFSESNVPTDRSTSIPFTTTALLTSGTSEAQLMPTIVMPFATDPTSEREFNATEIAILASNNTIKMETSTILSSSIGINIIAQYKSTKVHSSTSNSNTIMPYTFVANFTVTSNTRLGADSTTTVRDEFPTDKSIERKIENSLELNPRNTTHRIMSDLENPYSFIIISLIPTLTLLCCSLVLMLVCIASHYKGKMKDHMLPNVEFIDQRSLANNFAEFSRKINSD